jgi:V8-like Glu-specific endopeptidase
MPWDKNLTNLNYVLADLYPLQDQSIAVVDKALLPKAHIRFQPAAIDNWHEILDQAEKRGKIQSIISIARKDYPENPFLEQAEKGNLNVAQGPEINQDINWNSQQPASSLEKIMGEQSTLLPISFLEVGLQCARSVARIIRGDGALGTGFLVKKNVLITNNHVLSSTDEANKAKIQFNYQQTETGLDLEPIEFELYPDSLFTTSTDDDWTAVKIKGDANKDWGFLELSKTNIKETDRVNIIQHPGGGPKQIALYHNTVTFVSDKRVQYLTDTLPGSSGSPVFNSQWQLVALHHSGGWIREPNTVKSVYRNEGINVNCIISGLKRIL